MTTEGTKQRWLEDLHALLRTPLLCIFLVPWTAFWSLVGLLGCRLDRARSIGRVWVARGFYNPGVLRVAGIRVEVAGTEWLVRGRPFLFASNHQGLFDIPAIVCALPSSVTFVSKPELFRIPLFGRYLRRVGHVPVGPERVASAARRRVSGLVEESWTPGKMIEEVARRLRVGDRLVIFPEGSRTRTGEVGPFKAGVGSIARAAGVPVVPLCIHGSDRIYGIDSALVRPGVIRICVGEPVAAEDPNLIETLRDRIIAMRPMAAAGGADFRPADGFFTGALRCEDR